MKSGKDYLGVGSWVTIINENEETLLLKRKGSDTWERPGGKHEFLQETLEQCAERETLEETGIKISVKYLLNHRETKDKDSHWLAMGFLGKHESGEAYLVENTKHDAVRWFPLISLPKVTSHTQDAINKYNEKKEFYQGLLEL